MREEFCIHFQQWSLLKNEGGEDDAGQVHTDPDLRKQLQDHASIIVN